MSYTIEHLFEGQSFKWVLESATDAMVISDQNGAIRFANSAMERLFGYERGEMLDLTIEHLMPEQFRGAHHAQRAGYGGQPRSRPMGEGLELAALRKNGSAFPVDISLSPLKTADGLLILATIHDITRRKLAEDSLRSLSARHQALLAAVPEIIVEMNRNLVYTWTNDAGLRFFGDDLIGRRAGEFLISRQNLRQCLKPLFDGREEVIYQENWQRRCDGEKRLLGWWCRGLTDHRGNVTGTLCSARDITERHEAQVRQEALLKELEVKNTELERFVYTVSHDLKSPLITIQGFSGMLEQSACKGDLVRMMDDIRRIRGAAEKMEMLLNDLLELSRIGRVVHPPTEVGLGTLAREAVELVAGHRGDVAIAVMPDLPTLVGDRRRLLEVLQNLIDNAIKFMGTQAAPCIEIGAREDSGETVCYVRDNGAGIDPRYHAKVFGLFERLDQQTEGTGIGLAIVQRIIEIHGGRIWIESEGAGHGTAICFVIPGVNHAVTSEV